MRPHRKPLISLSKHFLTRRVGEVEDAGGRLQQVGAAGRQVAGDWHDGHAVTTLLGTHDAVVLRLTHATITTKESRDGGKMREEKANVVEWGKGGMILKKLGVIDI